MLIRDAVVETLDLLFVEPPPPCPTLLPRLDEAGVGDIGDDFVGDEGNTARRTSALIFAIGAEVSLSFLWVSSACHEVGTDVFTQSSLAWSVRISSRGFSCGRAWKIPRCLR